MIDFADLFVILMVASAISGFMLGNRRTTVTYVVFGVYLASCISWMLFMRPAGMTLEMFQTGATMSCIAWAVVFVFFSIIGFVLSMLSPPENQIELADG